MTAKKKFWSRVSDRRGAPRRSRGLSFAGNDLNSARIIDDVSPDGEAEAEAEAKVTAKEWPLQ